MKRRETRKPLVTLLSVTLLTSILSAIPACAVFAELEREAAGVLMSDDSFEVELRNLKKDMTDLTKRIEDTAKSIERLTDPGDARKEIEQLMAAVGPLLGAVADNGSVSQLGAKTLQRIREKLRNLEQNSHYPPERTKQLIEYWRDEKASAEGAIAELEKQRNECASLLRKLQIDNDFIGELMEIQKTREAIQAIQQLTKEIRKVSEQLKKLLGEAGV
jgi:DNA repair exonuclease SbcCD ATPase subunit